MNTGTWLSEYLSKYVMVSRRVDGSRWSRWKIRIPTVQNSQWKILSE